MKRKPDLLEPLMASLLTLDWEITAQTIQKFEQELEVLKKKLARDPQSKGLIELALPVCNYLRVRKGAASPASIQFLHETTRTLHLFRRERKLGVGKRKEVLKKLLAKFRRLIADVQRINAAVVRATQAKPLKKATKKKPAVRKAKKLSPSVEVLKAIKSRKKGIDITTLKEITGFTDSQIRNIVYRAYKEGKVKRISRGVYASA